MPKFILIHKNDEISEVLEMIQSLKESEAYLIIPDDAAILDNGNSETLIQEAAELGTKVHLAIFPQASEELENTNGLNHLTPEKEKIFKKFFARRSIVNGVLKGKSSLSKLIFGFVSLLLVLWLVNYLSPVFGSVQVVITPKKDSLKFDLNVSSGDLSLPSQIFQIIKQETKSFPASGKKELKTKAGGFINVYNGYSSKEQILIKNTRFISKGGQLFRSVKTVTVPGAAIEEGKIIPSSIKMEILADQIGPEYNIGPTDFTIPGLQGTAKYEAFYGKSEQALKGGANGIVSVVTKDDLKKAQDNLEQDLQSQLEKEIKEKIPANLLFLNNASAIKILESKFSENENDVANAFDITLKASIKAIVFNEKNVRQLISVYLETKLSSNQLEQTETRKVNYDNIKTNWDKEILTFSVKGEEIIAAKLDLDKIQARILGQPDAEISNILSSWSGIDKSEVIFWPIWLRTAPVNLNKIHLTVEN